MQLMHTPQNCREEHVGGAHPKNIYDRGTKRFGKFELFI